MGLDFGLIRSAARVGIGTRQDLTIRYEESNDVPLVTEGEVVMWHKNAGKGEFYEPTPDETLVMQNLGGGDRAGQTFTIGTVGTGGEFFIANMTFKMYRTGFPGTITGYLKATDGAGKPTGAVLATGTTNGNTLGTSSVGTERTITFVTPYNLQPDTKYAIFVKCPGVGSGIWLNIKYKVNGVYPGGNFITSADGESSWTVDSTGDFWFQAAGSGDYMFVNLFGITRQIGMVEV